MGADLGASLRGNEGQGRGTAASGLRAARVTGPGRVEVDDMPLPEPGPLVWTSTLRTPCSMARRAACSAAIWAA